VIYLSLRQWSGQFGSPKVMGKIRRSIKAWVDQDVCVLVVDDGAGRDDGSDSAAKGPNW
jgi:hypothetical protein